jgi:hypothetical protein
MTADGDGSSRPMSEPVIVMFEVVLMDVTLVASRRDRS